MTYNVLLVDDEADVLHSLRRMLRNQPYLLYTANSGEQAQSVLKAARIDVVVADECTPGMSGTDLLVWVAKNFPDVVRILLSGQTTTETAVRAINEAGVYYFFTKPCNEAHLAIVIAKALERKELLAQQKQLLEMTGQQARDRERFARDMEVIHHAISRDLKRPMQSVVQSCRLLLEQHCDAFDLRARSLLEGTLEAVSDMQSLVDDLLHRMRGRQPAGPSMDTTTLSAVASETQAAAGHPGR